MNLAEVARRAGVSTATVSRVINGSENVSHAKRERVEAAIHALRFHPNPYARNLARSKSRSFGVILANVENPFFLMFTSP